MSYVKHRALGLWSQVRLPGGASVPMRPGSTPARVPTRPGSTPAPTPVPVRPGPDRRLSGGIWGAARNLSGQLAQSIAAQAPPATTPPATTPPPPASTPPATSSGGGGGGGGGSAPVQRPPTVASGPPPPPVDLPDGSGDSGFPLQTVLLLGGAAVVGYLLLRRTS